MENISEKEVECDEDYEWPISVMLPGQTVRLVSFKRSQDGLRFARDLEKYGEEKAFELHPEARK